MNTKHTRVVVTLLLTVATLATMGFSTTNGHGRSLAITADHTTCQLAPLSLSAIELLEFVDDSCDPNLINRVEMEIGWATSGQLSTEAWLDEFYTRIRPTVNSVEYLEIVESEMDSLASSSTSFSARPTARFERTVSETDIAEMELDRGLGTASSPRARIESILNRSRSTSAWPSDLLELSETDVN